MKQSGVVERDHYRLFNEITKNINILQSKNAMEMSVANVTIIETPNIMAQIFQSFKEVSSQEISNTDIWLVCATLTLFTEKLLEIKNIINLHKQLLTEITLLAQDYIVKSQENLPKTFYNLTLEKIDSSLQLLGKEDGQIIELD